MIKIINAIKTYKSAKGESVCVLNNITLTLPSNGLISIVGKSGSGKTTLLNIIGGIDKLDRGKIIYDNYNSKDFKDINYNSLRNNYIGLIFQEFQLIETLTVYENVNLALRLQKISTIERRKKIKNALEKLEIINLIDRYPNELSGGERQRVAIARVIAKGCKVILADEPTGSLDEDSGNNVFSILKSLSKELLVVVVTHDKEFAEKYSDSIYTIKNGSITSESVCKVNCTYENEIKFSKSNLSLKDTLYLSRATIYKRLKKIVFTSLMLTLTLSLFLIAFNGTLMNNVNLTINAFSEYEIESFKVGYNDSSKSLSIADFSNNNFPSIKYNEVYSNINSFESMGFQLDFDGIDTKHQFYADDFRYIVVTDYAKIDIKTVGYTLEDGDIVVTDYLLASILYKTDCELTSIEEFNQKEITFLSGFTVKIAGIMDTDYESYYETIDEKSQGGYSEFLTNSVFQAKKSNDYITIYMNENTYNSYFAKRTSTVGKTVYVTLGNNKDSVNFIKYLYNNDILHMSYISQDIYEAIKTSGSISNLSYIIALVFSFLVLLFIYSFISNLIFDNKKIIGIIICLGGSKKDLIKIFLVHISIVLLLSYILSVIIGIIATITLNNYIIKYTSFSTSVLYFNLFSPIIVFAILFIIATISLLLPITRLKRKPPIDLVYIK